MLLFFEILLAALAVFGLWCLLQLALGALLGGREVAAAVHVTDNTDLERLDTLLEQASHLPTGRGVRPLVLLDEALLVNGRVPARVRGLCHRYGATYLVIKRMER